MYHTQSGRFCSRDPIGYAGSVGLLEFLRSNPVNRIDTLGLSSECYCGPDMSGFLVDLVNEAIRWRRSLSGVSRFQGIRWLLDNGGNLDWWSTLGPYHTANCPSKDRCIHTYWLCGECVHDHWIGNFMFGFIGRLFRLPDWILYGAADWAQGRYVDDPPWDVAGYQLAWLVFAELSDPNGDHVLCHILKSNPGLWDDGNDTTPGEPPSGVKWPTPHARGYKGCRKCPEPLPAQVRNTLPGGKFGGSFPGLQ